MVVKDRVGRHRYVAFVVTPAAERRALLAAMKDAPARVKLVTYEDGRGLVRCAHTAKEETIAFLTAMRLGDSRVRTVGTSGTIRRARRKYLDRASPGNRPK